MLPPMKTLALRGYSVGLGHHDDLEHKLQVSFLRELTLHPGKHSDTERFLESLMRGGNLCLEVLEICRRSWLGSLMQRGRLKILRSFLQSFKGLKKLVISGSKALPFRPMVDAISWHSDTLEVLVMYDPVSTPTTLERMIEPPRVTHEVVQQLCATCTRLRSLTLALHFGTVSIYHVSDFWDTG